MDGIRDAFGPLLALLRDLGVLLMGVVVWVYARDRADTKSRLDKHGERIGDLEQTVPTRIEVATAIAAAKDDLTARMEAGFRYLGDKLDMLIEFNKRR